VKMMKNLLIASTLVLAAAAPAVFAQAEHGPGPRHGMAGGPGLMQALGGHRMLEALEDAGVAEATRSQIKAIFTAAQAELKPLRDQAFALHQQALGLWAAPNLDAVALEAARKQQMALHDQVTARMQRAFIDAGRLLTPEQRAKLAERVKKMGERMKRRMQHG
jgi:periplasmic protein CpxP/Spy